MDLSVLRKRSAQALGGLIVLAACAGNIQATTNTLLLAAPVVSGSVTCNTATGPGAPITIIQKPAAATLTTTDITVYAPIAPGAGLVVTPASADLKLGTASVTFSVSAVPGCVGFTDTTVTVLTFQTSQAGAAGVVAKNPDAVTASVTNSVVVAAASGLVAPASVTVTCTKPASGNYIAGAAQTISVTSAVTGGIPFTIDTSVSVPYWLTLSSTAGGTASSTAVSFTAQATAGNATTGCASLGLNKTTTYNIALKTTVGGPNAKVVVTLLVVPPTPLTVTPALSAPSVALSYVKSSGSVGYSDVSITSTPSALFFQVNTASLPIWLTVDFTSGTTTKSLRFSTTGVADNLAPGTYKATVYLTVTGYADSGIDITLLVTNKPPKLTVGNLTVSQSWVVGSNPAPTTTITATSSDSPIQYSITTGGLLAPIVTNSVQQTGLAYSFGTPINISFPPLVLAAAVPGNVLTGTVTFTWGSPASTTVVTISLTVTAPGSTLTSISPATVPPGVAGNKYNLVLTGAGFVGGSDPTTATRVGIVGTGLLGGAIATDPNLSWTVTNGSNIALTITLPSSADAALANFTTGGPINLGIVNGTGTTSTGFIQLQIGVGPLIQAITSASSFIEVTPGTNPTIAPYDMISIFGSNFCSSGTVATNCSSTTILTGALDSALRYPLFLSPDLTGATQRQLVVTFLKHSDSTSVGVAPLLFATNSQINAIVPASVPVGVAVDVVVSFGYSSASPATLLKSAAVPVTVANFDPGVFAVGANGQGSGAALKQDYSLVTSTNPIGMRSTQADSDVMQLYVTGLGVPTSTQDNTSIGSGSFDQSIGADCIGAISGTGNYMSALQTDTSISPSLTTIDGTVIQSRLLNTSRFPPCLIAPPTVKIGGVAGTVTYAGFVPDTVTGLYQINVKLPATTGTLYPNYPNTANPINVVNGIALTQPVQLPVTIVMSDSTTSQSGVTVWVAPRLKVASPVGGLTPNGFGQLPATVGIPWGGGNVVATEGTATYKYAVTSGVLPAGLVLGSDGTLSGKPAANTGGAAYSVTITATDSAPIPVTGTVTFTIAVAGGLYVTSTGTTPYNETFFTGDPTVTTVTASGGVYPYTYVLTTTGTVGAGTLVGLTVNKDTGVVSTTAALPAGTYHVLVTATDKTTLVTGSINFDVVVALLVTQAGGTVTTTGGSGTITYAITGPTNTDLLAIDDTTGIVTIGTATAATLYPAVTVTATDTVTKAPGAALEGTGSVTFSFTTP